MIPRTSVPAALRSLAGRQAQVVSREQVLDHGLSDAVISRLIDEGRLTRLTGGIYALAPGGWEQQAWAGVLLGGPQAVLGLRSAGYLHGLVADVPADVEIFSPSHLRRRDPRWRMIRAERRGSGEPPRTRVAETVVDLAEVLEPGAVVSLLAEAVGRRRVRPSELRAVLSGRQRHSSRRLLEELLVDVGMGAESVLEVRYLRDVERAHALPPARRQVRLAAGRADVLYEEFGLVVELDGRAHHGGARALSDMERDNLHLIQQLVTLRYGWKQVTAAPCRVAAQVAAALTIRGWQGSLRPCRRCRPCRP